MSKFSKFISGKGFYLVLAFCLIAVGAAGFLAVSSAKIDTKDNAASSAPSVLQSSTPIPKKDEPVQKTVSDEPKESKAESTVSVIKEENFESPVKDGTVIKKFDNKNLQYSSTFCDMRIHLGMDISAKNGADVFSSGVGTVKKVYTDDNLGRVVEIDHGDGIVIKYCGLSDNITVKQDYKVEKGQKLGTLSGSPSESADTAHIHIEATSGGKYIDPNKLFKLK